MIGAYVIYLTSRHTGERIWLGSKFTEESEAYEYIEKFVCQRCNRVCITSVPKDWHWIDRTKGFGPLEDVLKNNKRKEMEENWLRTGNP